MTYTKPAVSILGDAANVIQALPATNYKTQGVQDGQNIPGHLKTTPAYDLDE
jgi:hypothetical protein